MRKLILYMLLCMPVAMLASLPNDAYSVYPEVWLRQDTTVQIPFEDSIFWTDEYAMYAVIRSLQPDSTECLWSFTEDDTVSLAVLTDGTYLFPAGKIRSRHPADFSRWCVYAYHSGLRIDSTKSHSMRLGEQVVYRQDSIGLVTDTLPAAIEVEELAYFRGNVSRLVSNAFQTYLALKYGVTLDYAPYISQAGDTLWHPADDEEFYHRVMGIGNDTVCAWSSLVSQSKEDSLLSIRTDSLAPNEYILIGDDNGAANWREEYDGEYVLKRTWRLRRFTQQPKVVTLTLQLPALEETADSLRLKITDINGMTLATIQPDSLIEDSVCIFSISQADTVVQLRLYGVNPHPIQTEQSDPNQSSGSDTNESPLVFDATNKLLYISGYPDDQVFTLYLYDNVGKYITSVNTYNPVDVRTLPNTVFYIEVMTDNQLVGAINIPLSVFSYLRSSFHAQTPCDSYPFVASIDDRISKWISVDPLADKYPGISPYAYCHWNPIIRTDPDGRDDLFDESGTYLEHIDNGTDYVMIQQANGSQQNLTGFSYAKDMTSNRSMLSNVASHYASQVGLNQNIGLLDNVKGGESALFGTLAQRVGMVIQDGQISTEASTSNNIMNALVHESDHVSKGTSGAMAEVEAIAKQVGHPTWANTTESYKAGIMNYLVNNANIAGGEASSVIAPIMPILNTSPYSIYFNNNSYTIFINPLAK